MNRLFCAILALGLLIPTASAEDWKELPEWMLRTSSTYSPPRVETVLQQDGWEIAIFGRHPGNDTGFYARLRKGRFTATVSWRAVTHLGDQIGFVAVVYTDKETHPAKLDGIIAPALRMIAKNVDGKETRQVGRMFKGPLHEFVRDSFTYEIWK